MRNYELILIFAPNLSKEIINELLGQVGAWVQELGGILEKQENQKEAQLAFLSFAIDSSQLESFRAKLKEEKRISRFMIKTVKPAPAPVPTLAKITPKTVETKEPKIDIEEIDRKLEEILKKTPL